jgi:hypothetical protein
MARLFGIIPLGIGLTVLTFAWSDDFGGPFGVPVFFRLFPSFIALGFVFAGGAILFGARKGVRSSLVDQALDLHQQLQEGMRVRGMTPPGEHRSAPRVTSDGYECPGCNAPVGSNADVSPHGDVKCGHCGRWFNVHG